MITRIAPSPTGFFHIGTLRTAYLNWLGARSVTNGKFVLRLDDTDAQRSTKEYSDYVLKVMEDYKLDYDAILYQSNNREIYYHYANSLLKMKRAEKGERCLTKFKDTIIIRSDGSPTYNFASVVDDLLVGVTCIIRGVDHICNLPIQKELWAAFTERPFPEVHHVGLLFEGDKKLSKRRGDGNVERLKDYDKEAVLNWVLRMGWSSKDPNFDKTFPIVPRDLAKALFWYGNLQASPSKINIEKLDWYHKKYSNESKGADKPQNESNFHIET